MNTARYVPEGDDYDLDTETHERVLSLTADGVDPMRFLTMSESDTAEGLIRGIDSVERLAGWRLANQSFLDPPSSDITEAIDAREAELTDGPTPDATVEPVAATDGGTTDTPTTEDNPLEVAEPEPKSEARPTGSASPTDNAETKEVHPAVKGLEAGDVLRVDRSGRTAYVWPSSAEVDQPYQSLELTADGDRRGEPIGLSSDEFARRLGENAETVPSESVDVRPPAKAVTGGDA